MFMFISLKLRVSRSSSCDLVIFSQMLSVLLNLFCSESNTWLKEASPSHVTWMVLLYDSCGAQVHGEISGLMEQCREATCTIDTSVYTKDPIFWVAAIQVCFWKLVRRLTNSLVVVNVVSEVFHPFQVNKKCQLDKSPVFRYFILIWIMHWNCVMFWANQWTVADVFAVDVVVYRKSSTAFDGLNGLR